jgi:hypothetical protein
LAGVVRADLPGRAVAVGAARVAGLLSAALRAGGASVVDARALRRANVRRTAVAVGAVCVLAACRQCAPVLGVDGAYWQPIARRAPGLHAYSSARNRRTSTPNSRALVVAGKAPALRGHRRTPGSLTALRKRSSDPCDPQAPRTVRAWLTRCRAQRAVDSGGTGNARAVSAVSRTVRGFASRRGRNRGIPRHAQLFCADRRTPSSPQSGCRPQC